METPTTDRIEKSIDLKATPARVWRALTDYKEFGAWSGVSLESEFEPGKGVTGHITIPGYEHLQFDLVVDKMVAEQMFSYQWHPFAIEPDFDYSQEPMTLVEFKLTPIDSGTRLDITETGFDKIPAARRDEAFRMNIQGWNAQAGSIETYLAENP